MKSSSNLESDVGNITLTEALIGYPGIALRRASQAVSHNPNMTRFDRAGLYTTAAVMDLGKAQSYIAVAALAAYFITG